MALWLNHPLPLLKQEGKLGYSNIQVIAPFLRGWGYKHENKNINLNYTELTLIQPHPWVKH